MIKAKILLKMSSGISIANFAPIKEPNNAGIPNNKANFQSKYPFFYNLLLL